MYDTKQLIRYLNDVIDAYNNIHTPPECHADYDDSPIYKHISELIDIRSDLETWIKSSEAEAQIEHIKEVLAPLQDVASRMETLLDVWGYYAGVVQDMLRGYRRISERVEVVDRAQYIERHLRLCRVAIPSGDIHDSELVHVEEVRTNLSSEPFFLAPGVAIAKTDIGTLKLQGPPAVVINYCLDRGIPLSGHERYVRAILDQYNLLASRIIDPETT